MREELSADRLRELLDYDPATGRFTYRVKRGHMRSGDIAGGVMSHGYVQIGLTASTTPLTDWPFCT